jgi:hypothetical protein
MAKKTLAEKVFYKIYDIRNKRYVTASREKSTWATLSGVQEKVRSICQPHDRYSYNPHAFSRKPEDFEIQMFHMVKFDRMNGCEAYEAKEKKAKEAKMRQQQIEEIKNQIKAIIPDVDFWRIRKMLSKHLFASHIEERLKTAFDAISALEKIR